MPFDSPSTSDPHPDWHDLLAGYALDNLSRDEQETLQKILAERPELKAEVLAYQETLALVPYALEPQSLPANLERTLMASAKPLQAREHAVVQRPPRRAPRWSAAAAVAALLIIIVGSDNYRLRQQQATLQRQLANVQTEQQDLQAKLDQVEQELNAPDFESVIDILRQPNALVYSLKGTEEAASSSGSLLTLPDHSEVQLVSHNLPVLPSGQVYRLWSVATETSEPMYCGQFNNTEAGNVQWTVPDALCNATPVRVIITVDAVVDPPVPKGRAVLTGEI
ncbi:MAG: anti-sigma factor domain-containing protein [Leptolyngbyaceae cyanobacterium]